MSRIEKHAEFYRGYLTDDSSLAPVAGVLVTAIAVWMLFYLLSLVGPAPPNRPGLAAAHGAGVLSRPAAALIQREPRGEH